ncbi:MAG: hypothetical protein GY739_00090 [Mesoflavibacter sp.]|nr:hypothetical protein [Mesoflavibacter sp.]
MEGNTMVLAGALMSLGVRTGIGCYNRRKKAQKIYKQKLSSLIISKGCGKTQLKKSLESLSSELVIVDVNSVVSGSDDLERLANGKDYIDSLLNKFPKKRFLLLLSKKEESEYYGVDRLNTFVVCPSIKLFETLKGNIDLSIAGNKERVLEMEKERLGLIRNTDTENLNIFDSFDELYQVIKTVYKLQSSF